MIAKLRKLLRIPRWVLWLLIAVGVGLIIWGLVGGWLLRLIFGGALVVASGAVAATGEVLKGAGAKPIPENDKGIPRRASTSGTSPKPKDEDEIPARPRQNNWR